MAAAPTEDPTVTTSPTTPAAPAPNDVGAESTTAPSTSASTNAESTTTTATPVAAATDGSSTTIPADGCAAAAELATAKLLTAALDAYAAEQPPCPGSDEATRLLGADRALADSRVAAAAAAAKAGDYETARILYGQALALDAGSTTALQGLASAIDPSAPAPKLTKLKIAELLREAGHDDKALEYITKALDEGEDATQAEELLEPSKVRLSKAWTTFLDYFADPLVWFAIIIGLLGLAFYVTASRTRNGHLNANFLKRWFGPRVKFDEDKDAGNVGARIRHVLDTINSESDGMSFRYVSASASDLDELPNLSELDGKLKPVDWLLKLIRVKDAVRVTPYLRETAGKPSELILDVTARKAVRRNDKAGSNNRYARPHMSGRFLGTYDTAVLAARAAGWLAFALHTVRPNTIDKPKLAPLGIEDADCYSHFLGGTEALVWGDYVTAREELSEAVLAQPDARAPRLNLAYVEVSSTNPYVIASGIARLQELLR